MDRFFFYISRIQYVITGETKIINFFLLLFLSILLFMQINQKKEKKIQIICVEQWEQKNLQKVW